MLGNITIDKIDFSVVGSDTENIKVSGVVYLIDKNEDCIDFTLEYRKTELSYFMVDYIDSIDMEEFDNISKNNFEDIIYNNLPLEDIEKVYARTPFGHPTHHYLASTRMNTWPAHASYK